MTHQWLVIVILRTALFLVVGGWDAAARFALSVRCTVGRIDVHVVHRAHSYRNARLDVTVGWELLVHGFVDVVCDRLVGDC